MKFEDDMAIQFMAAEEFHERLRIAREAAGFGTREHFRSALNTMLHRPDERGIAYSTINSWEHGKSKPSLKYFTGIVRLTGVSADMLLGTSKKPLDEQKGELEKEALVELVSLMRVIMQIQRECLERLDSLEDQAGNGRKKPRKRG